MRTITKSCFYFKPENNSKTKKKRGRKSILTEESNLSASYMSAFNTENKEERELRYDVYQTVWMELESQIREVQDGLNEVILTDLLKYVGGARGDVSEHRVVSEIPTGTPNIPYRTLPEI